MKKEQNLQESTEHALTIPVVGGWWHFDESEECTCPDSVCKKIKGKCRKAAYR